MNPYRLTVPVINDDRDFLFSVVKYFVYVIKSQKDGRLYKGKTSDPKKRLATHNAGKVRSTKGYKPWKLVYSEELKSEEDARARELYLKSGDGRDFLNSLDL